jgi:hypothetical protein
MEWNNSFSFQSAFRIELSEARCLTRYFLLLIVSIEEYLYSFYRESQLAKMSCPEHFYSPVISSY